MNTVTLNNDQRLFVIPAYGGFSCLGFDVAFKRLSQFCELLGRPAPDNSLIGTLDQYNLYREAESDYIATKPTGTHFDPETPEGVKYALEIARMKDRRVRIWCGDVDTGRPWLDEHDVIGGISRSGGPLKCPLLIRTSRSHGGGAILTASVLRIVDADSHLCLYSHPKFKHPTFTTRPSEHADYSTSVLVDGVLHANFKTAARAQNWIDFMRGNRMRSW